MRQMQGVLWTKGLLLSPQHLQAQDRYLADQMVFRITSLARYPWGFSCLKVDAEALESGVLSIPQAAGILEDGLLFDFPDADQAPESKSLESYWGPDQSSMVVYLGIPEYRPGDQNLGLEGSGVRTRFSAEVTYRRDENTGLAEKPMELARKNFRLLAAGESREGFTCLPVARVLRDASGACTLDPRFVPPLLDFAASGHLVSMLRRIESVLLGKSANLSGLRRQHSTGRAGFGAADIPHFWLLYTVNSHLPEVRHLLDSGPHHPRDLYSVLLSLAGALTTFSQDVDPGDLPVYRHDDLTGCFTELDTVVTELLETVISSNAVSLSLEELEPSVRGAELEEDRYLRAVQVFLAVRSDLEEEVLVEKAPAWIKISSKDDIQRLFHRSVRGVGLSYVREPPGALPIRLDYRYFKLDISDPLWEKVLGARSVAVWSGKELENPVMELVLVLPPEDG